ncbi:MAG: hypothetical protein HW414_1839 [Dehalococcoidia bacterium]|nr:hypothetical protein [Dehalococcoidia bacterium]
MPQDNGTFTPEEVENVKAQLTAETEVARRGSDEAIKTRDQAIAGLQAAVQQAQADHDATTAQLAALRESLKDATGKYRSLLTASNPAIPDELVQGEDIGALDASMEKARTIVEKVKAAMKDQSNHTTAPAGAPPRSAPDVESLSPTDKIKLGLRR